MRLLRLFALLDQLRGRSRPVAAEALARELGVSLRTIYRDMAALQGMGVPLRGEAGVGYRMEPGYFLPPQHLDADEMEAVMLGLRLVEARGDAALGNAARRVAAKLAASMPAEAGEAFKRLPLRAASRAASEGAAAARNLAPLRQALRDRAILAIGYTDLGGRITRRQVRPLGLTAFDTVWLLTAWCEERKDFRNFRLDRIRTAEPTGARFRPERGQRFEDYLRQL